MKKTFEEKNMRSLLFRMGIPAMMGMLVVACYNIVDTYFIAGLGTEAVAASSVIFPISMLVSGIAFAFGSGAASAISRLIGSGEERRAREIANTSFFSALIIAGIIAGLIAWFHEAVFSLFGASAEIMDEARDYGLIILIGAVVNVGTVTLNNMIRAEGFAKISMITMSLGALMNIILDPILIYTAGLGIRGAAVATVAAQTIALLFILEQYRRQRSVVKIAPAFFRLDRSIYAEVLKVGIPVLIYQGLNSLAIAIINTQASVYGPEAVAAFGIVTRVFALISYVVFGFAKGLQPVAGYTYGASQYGRLQDAVTKTRNILSSYCLITAVLVLLLSEQIIGAFTADTFVLGLAVRTLRFWTGSFIFLGYQMTYVTAFLAMGRAKEGSIIGLSRQGLLLIPLLFILRLSFGLDGIIYAQPAADILTFIMTVFYAQRLKRSLGRNEAGTPITA